MSDSDQIYVRLHPYDPRNGFVAKQHGYDGETYAHDKSTGAPIWYIKDRKDKAKLAALRQPSSRFADKPLLQIMEEDEFRRTQDKEQQIRLAQFGLLTGQRVEGRSEIDPQLRPAPVQGRERAIPSEGPKPAREDPAPAPEGGPMTTASLPRGRGRGRSRATGS